MTNPQPTVPAAPPLPKLGIAQVLLEEVSFRHVGDFLARDLAQPIPPTPAKVNVQVVRSATEAGRATVRLKVVSDDATAAYHYAVSYLVFFTVDGPGPTDLDQRLAVTGGNMAMPFVRELVANLSSRGRFGAVWVAPVNFNKLILDASGQGETNVP